MKHLTEHEIGNAVYYPLPLHLQECFATLGGKKGDCPVAEELCEKVVSIPIYSELSTEQMDYVIATIKEFYR
jgi:dTDP-4-amino-4,6-dideoxygalactose transaminase